MSRRRLRRAYVYALHVVNPRTGREVRFGYIGKTRRPVRVRVGEHVERQGWGHLITGYEVLWHRSDHSLLWLELRLWWAEVWRIVLHRPLFNIEWNRRNPSRIKPWEVQKCPR